MIDNSGEDETKFGLIFHHEDFKDYDALIHINNETWLLEKDSIKKVIKHEIAHHYLGHKGMGDKDYDKIEEEAEQLVEEWSKNS